MTTDEHLQNLLPELIAELEAANALPKSTKGIKKKIGRIQSAIDKMNRGGVFFGTEKDNAQASKGFLTPNAKAMQQQVNRMPVVETPMEVKSGMKPKPSIAAGAGGGASMRYAVLHGRGGGGGGGGQENAKPVLKLGMSPVVKSMQVPSTPSAQDIKSLITGSAFRGRKETFV